MSQPKDNPLADAVQADPWDADLRRVYADWLEESGDAVAADKHRRLADEVDEMLKIRAAFAIPRRLLGPEEASNFSSYSASLDAFARRIGIPPGGP